MSQMQRFLSNILGGVQRGVLEFFWFLVWVLGWAVIGFAIGSLKGVGLGWVIMLGGYVGIGAYFPIGYAVIGWFRKQWRQAKEEPKR